MSDTTAIRTEFPFVLPRGYVDIAGTVHREGVMRLATARDELFAQMDQEVRRTPAYLSVVLLAKTITKLGDLSGIGTGTIEGLFASDLAFLQDMYRRINQEGHTEAAVSCPSCQHHFTVDISGTHAGE